MPAVALTGLVDGNDVWMVEMSGRFGFGVKPLDGSWGSQVLGRNHLEGDEPIQAHLTRLIDHAHAASTDLTQQLVIAKVTKRAHVSRPLTFARGGEQTGQLP